MFVLFVGVFVIWLIESTWLVASVGLIDLYWFYT